MRNNLIFTINLDVEGNAVAILDTASIVSREYEFISNSEIMKRNLECLAMSKVTEDWNMYTLWLDHDSNKFYYSLLIED